MSKPKQLQSTTLYKCVQTINWLTLPLAVATPWALGLFGIRVQHSTRYDYFYSIEQFVPKPLERIFYPNPLTIQTVPINDTKSLFFPGIALDTLIGTIQTFVVGLDLWKRPPQGRMRTPMIQSSCFLLYACMYISAFPLHCLKDYPLFDISSRSFLTQALFWIDTFSTSCSPPFMLLSGLVEVGWLHESKQFVWAAWIM